MTHPESNHYLGFVLRAVVVLSLTFSTGAPCRAQGLLEWLFGRGNSESGVTELQAAIERGLAPDGVISRELEELDDYTVRSRADAEAICKALQRLPVESQDDDSLSSPLYLLASLFQDVENSDVPAFEVLSTQGVAELVRIYDQRVDEADEDEAEDLVFVLRILTMYGAREGAERVVSAAKLPLLPDEYYWHGIFAMYGSGHRHGDLVFESLGDAPPGGFIGISLLDGANDAAREEELKRHPFNSEAGARRLREWIEDPDPDHFSYGVSAAAAIPFLSSPLREQILDVASKHIDPLVRMEAAWASATIGNDSGLDTLAVYCLNVNYSERAQEYLEELEREDRIPAEAKEPGFRARAEFASWLAHPNELAEPPDEVEIVDSRELAWPPEREKKPYWVIRYRLRDRTGLDEDDEGCGLVGDGVWCFFSRDMHERPPEDVYAIHCYWEMTIEELIEEEEVADAGPRSRLLDQWQGEPLRDAEITHVATLSRRLRYPAQQVAVATAMRGDASGWVVLDGARTRWYPQAEQPPETQPDTVLMIHVGRELLGFRDEPDRTRWLRRDQPKRDPVEYIAAYEKLMGEAAAGNAKKQEELLGSFSPLDQHFDDYVTALSEATGTSPQASRIDAYRRLLDLAARTDPSIRSDVYASFGVLRFEFAETVDALIAAGEQEQVAALVELFGPHWQHNYGYGLLGAAEFKLGRFERAEPLLVKLRDGLEDYSRSAEMGMLAEIWLRKGDADRARELLVDCLKQLEKEIADSEYRSDRKLFANDFANHRATYIRLFPDGAEDLSRRGVPEFPLRTSTDLR